MSKEEKIVGQCKSSVSKELEALKSYDKIDNTLCLNNMLGKLEFGIDTDENSDCDSVVEMVECLENIKQSLIQAENTKLDLDYANLQLKTKSKKEMAFDIIKEKKVDVNQFQTSLIVMGSFTYRYYINNSRDYHTAIMVNLLEEDEFNTLKEMLE